MDFRGLIDRINVGTTRPCFILNISAVYVGDHKTLLDTTHIQALGLMVSGKKNFKLSYYKTIMETLDSQVVFRRQGVDWQDLF